MTQRITSDLFADEEIGSEYEYRSGYLPKPLAQQIALLRELFPELGATCVNPTNREFPLGAEGRFAVPRWWRIGRTYTEAVQKVFVALSQTRDGRFYNWCEGGLGPNRLRQHTHTLACLTKLRDQQEGHDILIFPAQFGLRHRGRSVRRAREVMKPGEFGLGAFAVGIMLLTHPERLMSDDDLSIDCAGDEYDYSDDGDYTSHTPYFYFKDGQVKFDAYWVGAASEDCGSASGFAP